MPSQNLVERIEQAIQNRDVSAAKPLIRKFLGKKKSSDWQGSQTDDLGRVCEWYRRLALYHDGLKIATIEKLPTRRVSSTSTDGLQLLWTARFLNALGASEFSIELIDRVELKSEWDFRIAGNIYLTQFRYDAALECFTRMLEKQSTASLKDYSTRVSRLSYADSLSGVGQYKKALGVVKDILKETNEVAEPFFYGVCHQVMGEIYCEQDQCEKGLEFLLKAMPLFPASDAGPDRGYLLKWIGYAQARAGNRPEAEKSFEASWIILKNLKSRPETWLDVLRLKNKLGWLGEEEKEILFQYPGLSPGFLSRFLPDEDRKPVTVGQKSGAKLVIYLDSKECEIDGIRYLGLSRELEYLAYVRLTGQYGLSVERAKTLLWPGAGLQYLTLRSRLEQLSWRLRNQYALEAHTLDGQISIPVKDYDKVKIVFGAARPPRFLETVKEFAATQIHGYYRIAKTQRLEAIKLWVKQGWIKEVEVDGVRKFRSLV